MNLRRIYTACGGVLLAMVSGACYHGGNHAQAFEGSVPDHQTSTLFIERDLRFVSLDGKTFGHVPAEYNFGPRGIQHDNVIGSAYDRKIRVLAGTHRVIAGIGPTWILVPEKRPTSGLFGGRGAGEPFHYAGSATNEEIEYSAKRGTSYVLRARRANEPDGWRLEVVPRGMGGGESIARKLRDVPHADGGLPVHPWRVETAIMASPEPPRQAALRYGLQRKK
ncbi:MAG TPA: hypothetical protein VGR35_16100 [Tepidisphaeraceae bacterium]|nr:hypothetical protein [Tepidisphaeraceae bacterium]